MNSKYSGEQVETLLDRVASLGDSNTDQKEPLDSFKIGEIRYNSNAKNPFGDDYILCLGQEVPIDKYPNAAMALSISSEFKNAKRVSVPDMSEGNMVDLGSNELFSINGELLGKIRMHHTRWW